MSSVNCYLAVNENNLEEGKEIQFFVVISGLIFRFYDEGTFICQYNEKLLESFVFLLVGKSSNSVEWIFEKCVEMHNERSEGFLAHSKYFAVSFISEICDTGEKAYLFVLLEKKLKDIYESGKQSLTMFQKVLRLIGNLGKKNNHHAENEFFESALIYSLYRIQSPKEKDISLTLRYNLIERSRSLLGYKIALQKVVDGIPPENGYDRISLIYPNEVDLNSLDIFYIFFSLDHPKNRNLKSSRDVFVLKGLESEYTISVLFNLRGTDFEMHVVDDCECRCSFFDHESYSIYNDAMIALGQQRRSGKDYSQRCPFLVKTNLHRARVVDSFSIDEIIRRKTDNNWGKSRKRDIRKRIRMSEFHEFDVFVEVLSADTRIKVRGAVLKITGYFAIEDEDEDEEEEEGGGEEEEEEGGEEVEEDDEEEGEEGGKEEGGQESSEKKTSFGTNILHSAVAKNCLEEVKRILDSEDAQIDPQMEDNFGNNSLHYADYYGRSKIYMFLVNWSLKRELRLRETLNKEGKEGEEEEVEGEEQEEELPRFVYGVDTKKMLMYPNVWGVWPQRNFQVWCKEYETVDRLVGIPPPLDGKKRIAVNIKCENPDCGNCIVVDYSSEKEDRSEDSGMRGNALLLHKCVVGKTFEGKLKDFTVEVVGEGGEIFLNLDYTSLYSAYLDMITENRGERESVIVVELALKSKRFSITRSALKEAIISAVKHKGSCLQYVSEELKNDKEFFLEVVKLKGWYIQYASEKLKNDKVVILEAVTQCGSSIRYASEDLKNDKKVVLEAVKQNGLSLQYASEKLKNDRGVVMEALKQIEDARHRPTLQYVGGDSKNDREFVFEVMKQYLSTCKMFASIYCFSDSHIKVSDDEEIKFPMAKFRKFLRIIKIEAKDLRSSNSKEKVALVMNGDIFDTWDFAPDKTPIPFSEMAKRDGYVREFCKELHKLLRKNKNVEVIYVKGNHDMDDVTEEDVIRAIEQPYPTKKKKWDREGKIIHFCDAAQIQRIHFEHGHRFDVFSAPPFLDGNLPYYPPGYYVTRSFTGKRYTTDNYARLVVKITSDIFLEKYGEDFENAFEEIVGFFSDKLNYEFKGVKKKDGTPVRKNDVLNYFVPRKGEDRKGKFDKSGCYVNRFLIKDQKSGELRKLKDKEEEGFTRSNFPLGMTLNIKFFNLSIINLGMEIYDPKEKYYLFDRGDKCDVLCVGHTHSPCIEYVAKDNIGFAHVNCGSWGGDKDGGDIGMKGRFC